MPCTQTKTEWKYTNDDFTIQLDWSKAGRMPPGATAITGVVSTAVDDVGADATSVLIVGSDFSGLFSRTRIHDGTAGVTYQVKQAVTFDTGEHLEDFIDVAVLAAP